jgi:K+-sensing histidine kinase KdpD
VSLPPAPDGGRVRHPVPAELVHELRTPLAHIIGYSEMLLEQAAAAGHDEYADDLKKVKAAGLRLLALLDENFRGMRPSAESVARGPECPPPSSPS